jgi:hypothetical protein
MALSSDRITASRPSILYRAFLATACAKTRSISWTWVEVLWKELASRKTLYAIYQHPVSMNLLSTRTISTSLARSVISQAASSTRRYQPSKAISRSWYGSSRIFSHLLLLFKDSLWIISFKASGGWNRMRVMCLSSVDMLAWPVPGDQVKKKPKVSHSDGASSDSFEGVSPRK